LRQKTEKYPPTVAFKLTILASTAFAQAQEQARLLRTASFSYRDNTISWAEQKYTIGIPIQIVVISNNLKAARDEPLDIDMKYATGNLYPLHLTVKKHQKQLRTCHCTDIYVLKPILPTL